MKYCIRCKKSISEISYLLHEKFCEYVSLEEYKFCHLCDFYLEQREFDDHIYCHKLEEEYKNFENNPYFKSKESLEIEENYEIIDKEQVLKEITEQEVFEKKFAQLKTQTKNSNIFTKKIIPYLFYANNQYKTPRALLICKY